MSVLEDYKEFNNCFYKKTTNTKARKIFEEVMYINTEYDRLLFFYHTIGKKDIYKIKALLKSFNEYYREFINEKEEEFYYFRNRATSKYIVNDNEITSEELENVFCVIKKQRNNLIQFKLLLINQLKELQCIVNFNNPQPAPVVSDIEPQPENIKPLQWKGTPTELTELIQSLIECKLLPPELTQREIYSRFKVFFNMDFDHENIKKKIRQRTKDLTPLLEKLMLSMEQYVHKDD